MPYIKQNIRNIFDDSCKFLGEQCDSRGELNYLFTKIGLEYFKKFEKNYESISMISDTMRNAADEWVRKHLHDYEDKKAKENGEVI